MSTAGLRVGRHATTAVATIAADYHVGRSYTCGLHAHTSDTGTSPWLGYIRHAIVSVRLVRP